MRRHLQTCRLPAFYLFWSQQQQQQQQQLLAPYLWIVIKVISLFFPEMIWEIGNLNFEIQFSSRLGRKKDWKRKRWFSACYMPTHLISWSFRNIWVEDDELSRRISIPVYVFRIFFTTYICRRNTFMMDKPIFPVPIWSYCFAILFPLPSCLRKAPPDRPLSLFWSFKIVERRFPKPNKTRRSANLRIKIVKRRVGYFPHSFSFC